MTRKLNKFNIADIANHIGEWVSVETVFCGRITHTCGTLEYRDGDYYVIPDPVYGIEPVIINTQRVKRIYNGTIII